MTNRISPLIQKARSINAPMYASITGFQASTFTVTAYWILDWYNYLLQLIALNRSGSSLKIESASKEGRSVGIRKLVFDL